MTISVVPHVTQRTIRIASPNSIVVIRDGRAIDEMTPEAALAFAQALIGQARKAQEAQPRVAEQLIADSALLLRAGIPLGLSNHPKIKAEARKEAEHNRELRRQLPGGIKSRTQHGVPSVRISSPPRLDDKKGDQ